MNAIARATHIVISYEITTSAGDFTPAKIVVGASEKSKASQIINELCAKESTTRLTADFVRSANVNFKHHNAEHVFCWVTYDKYLTEARVQSVINNRTETERVEAKPNTSSFRGTKIEMKLCDIIAEDFNGII